MERGFERGQRCGPVYTDFQSIAVRLSHRKGPDSDGDYRQLGALDSFGVRRPPNDLLSIHAKDLGQRGVGQLGTVNPWTNWSRTTRLQRQGQECQLARNRERGASDSLPWSCFKYTALISRRVRSSTWAIRVSASCFVSSGNAATNCWNSASVHESRASFLRRPSAYGYCGYRELRVIGRTGARVA